MRVPQFMPYVGMEEYEAIKSCFENNWITEGPKAAEFSDKLLEIIGSKYGVFAPNGTLSLYLALRAMGIGPGDEVIVPDFTFIASANAVEMVGARPVFADVGCHDLQLRIDECERVRTDKTKAIMPVHIFGFAADMTEIMAYANEHDLMVIEDAAQALSINWEGKGCGSFGDTGSFSFFADKTLTTCEGGFVTTDDEEIYNKLLLLRNQGRLHRGTFEHPAIGYNFRMNDVQAAIGLAQLKKLPEIVRKKQINYVLYRDALADIEEIELLSPAEGVEPYVPFRVVLRTTQEKDPSRNLMGFMKMNGVEPRSFFYPLHLQPCFDIWADDPRHDREHFGVSEHAYDSGVCLPSFAALTESQISYVCDVIKEFYRGK
jgi:perosamine synthetase